jgi:hypothetical protein
MKTKTILRTKLSCLAMAGLAMCVVHTGFAQPAGQTNYQWSANGDKVTWSQAANWVQGTPPLTDGTSYQIDTYAVNNSLVPITMASTDVVKINDSMFGPMWGQTLNLQGSVTLGFGMFTWGDMNGPLTTLNVQPGASFSVLDTLATGTAWWFPGGAHVEVNVYSNAFIGVNWLQHGGHLNVLNGGTVSVTNGFNTGTATGPVFAGGTDSDATRTINLQGTGKLILPASYTATVNDWLNRGILQAYGSPALPSQTVIDEADTNWPGRTVVHTTATGAATMMAIRIELPRTNVFLGGVQQAQVFADYDSATNVNVTLFATGLVYQSASPSVATITAAGQVRAVGVGSGVVKAIIGALSNSVTINVAPYTNTPSLLHRYSFSEDVGNTTTADSIGGSAYDGTLYNGSSLGGGILSLNGVDGYVVLPPGILSGLDSVTIETWATFAPTIGTWAVLFTFGDTDGTSGHNYISFQPHTGPNTTQSGIKNASTEQNPFFTPVLDGYTNVHIAAVFHPEAGYCSIYTNGVLAAINSNITVTLTDALSTGDPANYIGHSLWSADPYMQANIDEFRIYSGPLTAGEIAADHALGPNALIGTTTSVALTAKPSGGNVILSWPTTSALVNVMSSPTLGSGATWSPVNSSSVTILSGNYNLSVPATDATRYFRLQKN